MRSRRGPSPYSSPETIRNHNNDNGGTQQQQQYNPLSQYEFDCETPNHNLINSSPTYNNDRNGSNNSNVISNIGSKGGRDGYRVYRTRWLMLFYLSLLNLLSDWAGLSVAPIATITSRAFNDAVQRAYDSFKKENWKKQ